MPGQEDTNNGATRRFAFLLDRAEATHGAALGFDELRELARLYRQHTARLARVRERADDPAAIHYLNALCLRGYGLLYASRRPPRRASATLAGRLAATLSTAWPAFALAWALLLSGMVVGAALAGRSPEGLYALVPAELGYAPEYLDRLTTSPAARNELLSGGGLGTGHRFFFGSYLFVHNTRVGLLAFATGVLAGIPTILLQLYNGILLGAFATIFLQDASLRFAAWILPHAIPELTAITLCATGGLLLGRAIALPGRQHRSVALQNAANAALLLVGAALPLFVLAAIVESGVRESTLGVAARLVVAGFLTAAVTVGGLWLRRLAHSPHRHPSWVRHLDSAASGSR
ncbi:stage II sporulation protein M [Candidatus Binatia bacterium]|nr:stage II sporulation protein M [Candidatus Binatia bacterium]